MLTHPKKMLLLFVLVAILTLLETAHAAMSQQWNQDVAGLGDNQAGSAASAIDASTEFYNPAGLITLKQQQVIAGNNLYLPTNQLSGQGMQQDTVNETNGGVFSPSPFLHYAAPITENWAFGFGVSSPFAAHNNWSTDNSYANHTADFSTYNVSTDFAYALNSKFSVGAGFDFVRVIMTNHDRQVQNNNTYNVATSGSQWSHAWHGGLLYQLTPDAKLGVAYHARVNYQASGAANVTDQNGTVLDATNHFVLSSTLPAYTTASVYVAVNPTLALEGSMSYTEWNQADSVTAKNIPQPQNVSTTQTENYNFKNTWRSALGLDYTLTSAIMLRAGVGYETSPYSDSTEVTYLMAGGSYDASTGLQYRYSDTLVFDLGWTHIFYLTETLVQTNNNSSTTASFSGSNDIIGVQLRWDML